MVLESGRKIKWKVSARSSMLSFIIHEFVIRPCHVIRMIDSATVRMSGEPVVRIGGAAE
jgi:hypothetical protein